MRYVAYLAPITALSALRIALSIIIYATAGKVVRAVSCQRMTLIELKGICLRPKNNASVVRVPYSLSNLSISGVSATTLTNAWKKSR